MMTNEEKLSMVRTFLGIPEADISINSKIQAYLTAAAKEIISWRYSYSGSMPKEVPEEYEMTQVMAVVTGYSQSGAENQMQHSENGILRSFKYSDMLHYIRANVVQIAGIL